MSNIDLLGFPMDNNTTPKPPRIPKRTLSPNGVTDFADWNNMAPLKPLSMGSMSSCDSDDHTSLMKPASMRSTASTKSTSSKSRSVKFSSVVKVRNTISVHDMTAQERFDCYLQDFEFDRIRQRDEEIIETFERRKSTAELKRKILHQYGPNNQTGQALMAVLEDYTEPRFEKHSDDDNEEEFVCIRGLECRLEKENLKRQMRQEIARNCVLLEQARQYNYESIDEEIIARKYIEASHQSTMHAVVQASHDRKVVKEHMKRDRKEIDPSSPLGKYLAEKKRDTSMKKSEANDFWGKAKKTRKGKKKKPRKRSVKECELTSL